MLLQYRQMFVGLDISVVTLLCIKSKYPLWRTCTEPSIYWSLALLDENQKLSTTYKKIKNIFRFYFPFCFLTCIIIKNGINCYSFWNMLILLSNKQFYRGVVAESEAVIEASANALGKLGFINYFGLQPCLYLLLFLLLSWFKLTVLHCPFFSLHWCPS